MSDTASNLVAAALQSAAALMAAFALGIIGCGRPAKDVPAPSVHFLEGRVVGPRGPAAGATVRVQATDRQTKSGADGSFRLDTQGLDDPHVTAWKEGHYIGGAAVDDSRTPVIALRALPAEDWAGYAWVDPRADDGGEHNCANCHQAIFQQWAGGGHGDAARNRRFMNLYDGTDWQGRAGVGWSLLAEHPHGAGVCTACHAPSVEVDDPAFHDLRLIQGVAAEGVHCDFCHKIQDAPSEGVGLAHGRFGMRLLRPREHQLFFGPWDDVDRGEDTYAAVYRESRYCAACHEGTIFGVHAYGTYSEWLASDARRRGLQCQSCHMAPDGEMTNIAPGHGGVERDSGAISNHRFAGGTAEMLRTSLHVELKPHRAEDRVIADVLVVARQVGHRVPTGFPDRNLVLLLEATDAEDRPVAAIAGEVLPDHAGGSVAGQSGKLYAKQLTDEAGRTPAPFWRGIVDVVDTRLHPEQTERHEFEFPPHAERLRVRLLYRRHWPQVTREKGWPNDEITVIDHLMAVDGDP